MEAGGLNLYGYVGNGPVMAVDPLGLDYLNLTGEHAFDLVGFNLPGSRDSNILNIIAHGSNISIEDNRSHDGLTKILVPADIITLLNGELGENQYEKINFYSCNSANTAGTGKKSHPYIYPPVPKSFAELVYDLTGIPTSGADGFTFPNYDGSELIFRDYNSSNGSGWGALGVRLHFPSK